MRVISQLNAAAARLVALLHGRLFKKPALANPILSRSGKYLAAVAPLKGWLNLRLINMETGKGDLLPRYRNFDVVNVHWVGDERLIYSLELYDALTGPSRVGGGGLFVVGRDGSRPRQRASTIADDIRKLLLVHRTISFVRQIPDSIDEVMVEGNLSSAGSNDLYVFDLNTGKTRLLTSGRPASRPMTGCSTASGCRALCSAV